jgi:hypothetical protein
MTGRRLCSDDAKVDAWAALVEADTWLGARGARNAAPDTGLEAGRAKSDEVAEDT